MTGPIAALNDVHGNLPALRAVLEEVASIPDARVVFGGDLAWGPLPRETVDAVRGLPGALALRGNADREVAAGAGVAEGLDQETAEITAACADALGAERRRYLADLPEAIVCDVAGFGPVRFCHGSPRADTDPITPATGEAALAAMLAGTRERVVVVGHTHVPFVRRAGPWLVVNAGSVGLPAGDASASWALLRDGEVELRRTAYDVSMASRAFASGIAGWELFAAHLAAPPAVDELVARFTRA